MLSLSECGLRPLSCRRVGKKYLEFSLSVAVAVLFPAGFPEVALAFPRDAPPLLLPAAVA